MPDTSWGRHIIGFSTRGHHRSKLATGPLMIILAFLAAVYCVTELTRQTDPLVLLQTVGLPALFSLAVFWDLALSYWRGKLDGVVSNVYEKTLTVHMGQQQHLFSLDEIDRFDYRAVDHRDRENQGWLHKIRLGCQDRLVTITHLQIRNDDGFAEWLHALNQRLPSILRQRIARGEALTGNGWRLDSRGLSLGRRDPIPVEELTQPAIQDNHLQIWSIGDEQPVLRLRAWSRNAFLLYLALSGMSTGHSGNQLKMGRFFFKRGKRSVLWLLPAGLFLAFLVFAEVYLLRRGNTLGVQVVPLTLTWVLFLVALEGLFGRVEFYEHGLVRRHIFGRKHVYYDDLRRIRIHFRESVLSASGYFNLKLTPLRGSTVKLELRQDDPVFGEIRDLTCSAMAWRLLRQMESREYLQWTNEVVITRDALEVTRKRYDNKPEAFSIPIDRHFRMDLDEPKCTIYSAVSPGRRVSMDTNHNDFYPHYYLLLILSQRKTADSR